MIHTHHTNLDYARRMQCTCGGGVHLDTATVEIHTPVVALAVPSQCGPATYRLGTADSTPAAVSRCARMQYLCWRRRADNSHEGRSWLVPLTCLATAVDPCSMR